MTKTKGLKRKRDEKVGGGPSNGTSRVINAPAASGVVMRKPPMKFRPSSLCYNSLFLSSSEMVGTIATGSSTTTFTATRNVAVPFNYPWLNGLAINFAKFRWRYLEFIYIPAVPTSQVGQVGMCLQYGTQDGLPGTLQSLSQVYGAVTAPVWGGAGGANMLNTGISGMRPSDAVSIRVDVSRFDKPWYKYIDATTWLGMDVNIRDMYVPVQLVTGAITGTASQPVGNVYVKYAIELIEPIPNGLNL
jgi:hypothetical protein